MSPRISFEAKQIAPARNELLQRTRAGDSKRPVVEAADRALAILVESARPTGLRSPLSKSEFADIFRGDGNNLLPAPLEGIYPRADRLALYIVTLGQAVCDRISALQAEGDFLAAFMLDAACSAAVENAVALLEDESAADTGSPTLAYSPGYCGWHLGAQKKIFARLDAPAIGVSLGSAFMMSPVKSTSGVLVSGDKAIHRFKPRFPCCDPCEDRTCRPRIQKMLAQ